jgi:predicted DNA-binding transcriptional regulator YafY
VRIQSAKPTGKTFERSQKFSLEKRLRDSFGVHSGDGKFEVLIRFAPRAADYVREKKWHPSQTLRELANGGLELKLNLSSLGEVQRWVLSWGGDARVLQPPELVESVRQAATAILNHAD